MRIFIYIIKNQMERVGREVGGTGFYVVNSFFKMIGVIYMRNIGNGNIAKRGIKLTLNHGWRMIEKSKVGAQGKVKHTQR